MAFPAKYRERLQSYCDGEVVVTIQLPTEPGQSDRGLQVYPMPEWQTIEKQLDALPTFDRKAQAVKRLLMGYATECQLDGAGRVLLPGPLREYSALDKKLVLAGQGNKFEIWSEAAWGRSTDDWLAVVADGEAPSEALAALSL